jgi:hypothetical protein
MKRCLVLLVFVIGMNVSGFAQCSAFPCVVATVTLTDQSKKIPVTSIYTPPTSGVFRVNAYMSATTGNNGGEYWQLTLQWADEIGSQQGYTAAFTGSNNAATAAFVVRDLGGSSISYATTFNHQGGTEPLKYNVFIVIEQLE